MIYKDFISRKFDIDVIKFILDFIVRGDWCQGRVCILIFRISYGAWGLEYHC